MIFAFCIFSSRGLFWKGDMHFLHCKHLGGRGDGTEKIFFFFLHVFRDARCRRLCPLFWFDITVLIELNAIYS